MRYANLQNLGSGGLSTAGAPSLSAFPRDIKLPSDTQWNAEAQMMLPWSSSLSVAYVGHHSFNTFQGTNINTVDLGSTFLPENQDTTLAASTIPGATPVSDDLMREIRGYGNINLQWQRGWRTYHSIQLSFQRRFQNGISFGFTDTIGLYDRQQAGRAPRPRR